MTAISDRIATPALRTRLARAAGTAVSRLIGTTPPTTGYQVRRGIRIPMRDGVDLLADHYVPDTPIGTLLVRGPYGRRWPFTTLYAAVYATRGYHVILQSVRGTFGSGGEFDPVVNEAADGADTAAWLRTQPWFTGSFGTVGPSYLGATQWALLQDPPPEMAAAVIIVGPHDFAATTWGTGSFAVNDFLGWSYLVSNQEDPNRLRSVLRQIRSRRTVARAAAHVPVGAAGRRLLGAGAPWWESWVDHPDTTDEFWDRYRWPRALDQSRVPVLLIGGWQDLFVEQTLAQYRALRDRDVDVALTVGPWTHSHTAGKAAGHVLRESLQWLGRHVGDQNEPPRSPVRICVTGDGGWRELPDWPPTLQFSTLYLRAGGRLSAEPEPDAAAAASFTFDPNDPTPTVGGRLLSPSSGRRRDDSLAQRCDVLTFTGAPLDTELVVMGSPVAVIEHSVDTGHGDLFVRVSEVDSKGRSRNVSDGYLRLDVADGTRTVTVELDPIAHRFAPGSRIRLMIAGGWFPRFARNLGSTHTVQLGPSQLLLPAEPRLP
ncbi:hydrolase [Mycobacterium sp. MS1601]|uniref:CocE/NonD family hydrolase n=1 Tax=Mycobacterium sp. MS1601 TaxID=1936029 RepID=UPI000979616F|nr:hydrolase [Mycobacterium sp. MS1601]